MLNLCAKNPEKLKYLILLDSAGIYEPSARKRFVEKVAKLFVGEEKFRMNQIRNLNRGAFGPQPQSQPRTGWGRWGRQKDKEKEE